MMALTAIFGGTFNPFHIGHYEMLSALQSDDSIGKILLMPDKIPPHKVCDFLADDETRIEMCRIAAMDFSKAELCLTEFLREGKSYTFDTVIELKKSLSDELIFVMGGDMLVYFDKWYKFEELIKEIPFYVFKRTDTDTKEFEVAVYRFRKMGMRITVSDKIITDVSSTKIRNDFVGLKELLPPKIYNFLTEKGIYDDRL